LLSVVITLRRDETSQTSQVDAPHPFPSQVPQDSPWRGEGVPVASGGRKSPDDSLVSAFGGSQSARRSLRRSTQRLSTGRSRRDETSQTSQAAHPSPSQVIRLAVARCAFTRRQPHGACSVVRRLQTRPAIPLISACDDLLLQLNSMTPQQFIAKWRAANLSERSACHQHFLDLCDVLGQLAPGESPW